MCFAMGFQLTAAAASFGPWVDTAHDILYKSAYEFRQESPMMVTMHAASYPIRRFIFQAPSTLGCKGKRNVKNM